MYGSCPDSVSYAHEIDGHVRESTATRMPVRPFHSRVVASNLPLLVATAVVHSVESSEAVSRGKSSMTFFLFKIVTESPTVTVPVRLTGSLENSRNAYELASVKGERFVLLCFYFESGRLPRAPKSLRISVLGHHAYVAL